MNKRANGSRWGGGVALLAGLVLVTSCDDPTTIGEDLPSPSSGREAIFTDTITVRTSTVLADSVASSISPLLLAGRYVDAQLGVVMASSYFQVGLSGIFTPDVTLRYDSLVLELTPSAYRYGDTTQVQTLAVHRLTQDFDAAKAYYFTTDALPYSASVLGQLAFRGSGGKKTLRLRLSDALGQELWTASANGMITSAAELRTQLAGLALVPGSTDNAALIGWSAAATVLHLYYHDPASPAAALVNDYPVAGKEDAHFFGLTAERTGTALAALRQPRQALGSATTAGQTFVQSGLGLATKVEFPHLLRLKEIGSSLVLGDSELQIEAVRNAENRYLRPPALLVPQLTDATNQRGVYFNTFATTGLTAPYQKALSARTGLEQGTYYLAMSPYIEAVLAGTIPNNGFLLSSEAGSATPERVVLGSATSSDHPLKLKLYYTRLR